MTLVTELNLISKYNITISFCEAPPKLSSMIRVATPRELVKQRNGSISKSENTMASGFCGAKFLDDYGSANRFQENMWQHLKNHVVWGRELG